MKKFILLTLFCFSLEVFSFRLSPLEISFSPSGSEATQTIRLESSSKEKIPVQVSVFARGIDSNGKETRIKSEDFKVFPPQPILPAGENVVKNIRVTYVGDQKILKEKAYRLNVRQIPVKPKISTRKNAKKAGVNFIYRYVASMYVKPENIKPNLQVIDLKRVKKDVKNRGKISFKIKNLGSEHALLQYYDYVIKWNRNSKVIPKNLLSQNAQVGNVLAGSELPVSIMLPKETHNATPLSLELVKKKL